LIGVFAIPHAGNIPKSKRKSDVNFYGNLPHFAARLKAEPAKPDHFVERLIIVRQTLCFLCLFGFIVVSQSACRNRDKFGCAKDDSCAAGHVCVAGSCERLCLSDLDCPENFICTESICQAGLRKAPLLHKAFGNGSSTCSQAIDEQCFVDALILQGENLMGSQVVLAGNNATTTHTLELAEEMSDQELTALLPPGLSAGTYMLSVHNGAGRDEQAVSILQGEPGVKGDKGDAGDAGDAGDKGDKGDQGDSGTSALVEVIDDPAPTACGDEAGVTIKFGQDTDGSGTLNGDELQEVVLCNGANGGNGSNGGNGGDGSNGVGMAFAIVDDATCGDAGGVKLKIGLDNGAGANAGNGTLDADEIDHQFDVCNGSAGSAGNDGNTPTITVGDSPTSCSNGGITLEIDGGAPQDICHGAAGEDGEDGEDGTGGGDSTNKHYSVGLSGALSRTMLIPQEDLIALCADDDGCIITMGASKWPRCNPNDTGCGLGTYPLPNSGMDCQLYMDDNGTPAGTIGDWVVSQNCNRRYLNEYPLRDSSDVVVPCPGGLDSECDDDCDAGVDCYCDGLSNKCVFKLAWQPYSSGITNKNNNDIPNDIFSDSWTLLTYYQACYLMEAEPCDADADCDNDSGRPPNCLTEGAVRFNGLCYRDCTSASCDTTGYTSCNGNLFSGKNVCADDTGADAAPEVGTPKDNDAGIYFTMAEESWPNYYWTNWDQDEGACELNIRD
jgi:hypothetical protein